MGRPGSFRGFSTLIELEIYRANARSNVQAFVAFYADRLQRDRLIEAAEQNIRPEAHAHGCFRGDAPVFAFERARLHLGRRRHHIPNNDTTVGVTDIDADLRNDAYVMFAVTVVRNE